RKRVCVAVVEYHREDHFNGEQQRDRSGQRAHSQGRTAQQLQDAERIGQRFWDRQSHRRKAIRDGGCKTTEQFCEPVIENDCARAKADKRVTVGRDAFIEPCVLGPYQSCLVDSTFHASLPCFCYSIKNLIGMLQITSAPFRLRLHPFSVQETRASTRRLQAQSRTDASSQATIAGTTIVRLVFSLLGLLLIAAHNGSSPLATAGSTGVPMNVPAWA